MNIIKLSRLNECRHQADPIPMSSLRRQAADGTLPGAFQFKPGGAWKIDLDVYDRATRDLIESHSLDSTSDTSPEQEAAILDDIYEEFCRAGQAN